MLNIIQTWPYNFLQKVADKMNGILRKIKCMMAQLHLSWPKRNMRSYKDWCWLTWKLLFWHYTIVTCPKFFHFFFWINPFFWGDFILRQSCLEFVCWQWVVVWVPLYIISYLFYIFFYNKSWKWYEIISYRVYDMLKLKHSIKLINSNMIWIITG